ncbi:MAG: sulfurtransferase TusA family protein [Thermoproteus sp.]
MEEIDVRGKACPDPLKEVAARLAAAPQGAQFKVLTDDYTCYLMLRRLAALNDVKIIGSEEGEVFVLLLQR